MADILFTDWRPFGGFQLSPTPVVIDEADPELCVVAAAETGLPNGYYRITETILWRQEANKYMLFGMEFGGVSGEKVAKEANGPNNVLSSSSGSVVIPVTDGTLDITACMEFPDQGGTGDGIIENLFINWERVA